MRESYVWYLYPLWKWSKLSRRIATAMAQFHWARWWHRFTGKDVRNKLHCNVYAWWFIFVVYLRYTILFCVLKYLLCFYVTCKPWAKHSIFNIGFTILKQINCHDKLIWVRDGRKRVSIPKGSNFISYILKMYRTNSPL